MADINDWMRGDGSDALKGTDNAYDIDSHTTNYLQDPLDNLLKNYRFGCGLTVASSTTITVAPGDVVCHNSSVDARRFRSNSTAVTASIETELDTGSAADSTMYYIYAVADAEATTFTVVFSTSGTFPTGVSYARKLGCAYRNAASEFTTVSNNIAEGTQIVGFVSSTKIYAGGGTAFPIDGSVPQISEGTPFTELTITHAMTDASRSLIVECGMLINGGNDAYGVFGVFSSAQTDAIVVCHSSHGQVGGQQTTEYCQGKYTPATTDPITYTVRLSGAACLFGFGASAGSTSYYGAAHSAWLKLTEVP